MRHWFLEQCPSSSAKSELRFSKLTYCLTFCFPWPCFHGENEDEASATVCTTAVLKVGTSCLHTPVRTLMFPKYIAVDGGFSVLDNLNVLV